jgi:hypothetical protein
MSRTASVLIVDALACVARELPQAHARMRSALGLRTVALTIGDELVHVALDDDAHPEPAITVRTSITTLTDVLQGDRELLDAVLAGDLDVIGEPNDLVAAADAMRWFLEGALRCLSIEPLADELFALREGGMGCHNRN